MRLLMGLGFGTFLGAFSTVFASAPVFNDFALVLPPSSHTVETIHFNIPQGAPLEIKAPFGDVTVVEQAIDEFHDPGRGEGGLPLASLTVEFSGQLPSDIFFKYPVLDGVSPSNFLNLTVGSQGIEGWGLSELADGILASGPYQNTGSKDFSLLNFIASRGKIFLLENSLRQPAPSPVSKTNSLKLTLNVPSPLMGLVSVYIMEGGSFTLKGLPLDKQKSDPDKNLLVILSGNSKKIKIENFSGYKMYLSSDNGTQTLENIILSGKLTSRLGDPRQRSSSDPSNQNTPSVSLRHLDVKSLSVQNQIGSISIKDVRFQESAEYRPSPQGKVEIEP